MGLAHVSMYSQPPSTAAAPRSSAMSALCPACTVLLLGHGPLPHAATGSSSHQHESTHWLPTRAVAEGPVQYVATVLPVYAPAVPFTHALNATDVKQ